jgi:hypothetical protein
MASETPVEDLSRPPKHPVAKALHKAALGYPETHEDHPWGERAYKVAGKVFLFMHVPSEGRFAPPTRWRCRAPSPRAMGWASTAG